MGYSLPLTDVTFANMLRDTIVDSSSDIVIADYSPAPIRERLMALGIGPERINAGPEGADAIESAVTAWTVALSRAALFQTSHGLPHIRLLLAWGV